MQTLFINQAFYPDSSASSQYLYDLVESFLSDEQQARDSTFTVLTAAQGYLDKSQNYEKFETIGNLRIIRVKCWKIPGVHKISRIVNASLLNLAFAVRLYFFLDKI